MPVWLCYHTTPLYHLPYPWSVQSFAMPSRAVSGTHPACLMMSAAVHTLCSASQLAVLVKLALRRKRDARGRAAMSSHVGACKPSLLLCCW